MFPLPCRLLVAGPALMAVLAGLHGCGAPEPVPARFTQVEGGRAQQGPALLARYQCGSCHAIPEVPSAQGRTAPTLAGFGRRSYIAGTVPNRPASLVQWLQEPQALVPGTRMPDMGVTEADARHMAAYLLSLQ
jgi:cytochrome c